jgi:hypothetical protein
VAALHHHAAAAPGALVLHLAKQVHRACRGLASPGGALTCCRCCCCLERQGWPGDGSTLPSRCTALAGCSSGGPSGAGDPGGPRGGAAECPLSALAGPCPSGGPLPACYQHQAWLPAAAAASPPSPLHPILPKQQRPPNPPGTSGVSNESREKKGRQPCSSSARPEAAAASGVAAAAAGSGAAAAAPSAREAS